MTETIGMQPRTGKVFTARMKLKEEIRKTEEELKTAGPIHSRDLRKHLKWMKNQLRIYDRYQADYKGRRAVG